MGKAGRILSINPPYAIPGGEIVIDCENFEFNFETEWGCFFDGRPSRIVAASPSRLIVTVPDDFDSHNVEIRLECGEDRSDPATLVVGKEIAAGLHIVSNPAVDPSDGSIIAMFSGMRGQSVTIPLFRIEENETLNELDVEIMNPSGIAFSPTGKLFVTNRMDGEVYRITGDRCELFTDGLGVATGIAFDAEGKMYVGDRRGTIFRISEQGIAVEFAVVEPSVAAYHLAFHPDGRLCVSAPGLSGYDSIYAIDKTGEVGRYFHGLGRPQGLAFDTLGNLYVAASFQARRGIIRITDAGEGGLMVAGMNVIGLCFNKRGDMIIATSDSLYNLPASIMGTLLS